jgi:hypothetical protein
LTPAFNSPYSLPITTGFLSKKTQLNPSERIVTDMRGIVNVMSGICGMITEIRATTDDPLKKVHLEINTRCENIQKLAEELKVVNHMEEISFRGEGPKTLRMAAKHCKHTACPVPAGIIKAIEVASGLALPKDASIQVSQEED